MVVMELFTRYSSYYVVFKEPTSNNSTSGYNSSVVTTDFVLQVK